MPSYLQLFYNSVPWQDCSNVQVGVSVCTHFYLGSWLYTFILFPIGKPQNPVFKEFCVLFQFHVYLDYIVVSQVCARRGDLKDET